VAQVLLIADDLQDRSRYLNIRTTLLTLLDLGAVALLAAVHRLPVIVDPSHATGRRDLVLPLARAGLAAGAAGVMIETHDDPGRALSDGPQALLPTQLREAMTALREGARR
jgi:3-deoxy-7-phosphoheptulonate synthase